MSYTRKGHGNVVKGFATACVTPGGNNHWGAAEAEREMLCEADQQEERQKTCDHNKWAMLKQSYGPWFCGGCNIDLTDEQVEDHKKRYETNRKHFLNQEKANRNG